MKFISALAVVLMISSVHGYSTAELDDGSTVWSEVPTTITQTYTEMIDMTKQCLCELETVHSPSCDAATFNNAVAQQCGVADSDVQGHFVDAISLFQGSTACLQAAECPQSLSCEDVSYADWQAAYDACNQQIASRRLLENGVPEDYQTFLTDIASQDPAEEMFFCRADQDGCVLSRTCSELVANLNTNLPGAQFYCGGLTTHYNSFNSQELLSHDCLTDAAAFNDQVSGITMGCVLQDHIRIQPGADCFSQIGVLNAFATGSFATTSAPVHSLNLLSQCTVGSDGTHYYACHYNTYDNTGVVEAFQPITLTPENDLNDILIANNDYSALDNLPSTAYPDITESSTDQEFFEAQDAVFVTAFAASGDPSVFQLQAIGEDEGILAINPTNPGPVAVSTEETVVFPVGLQGSSGSEVCTTWTRYGLFRKFCAGQTTYTFIHQNNETDVSSVTGLLPGDYYEWTDVSGDWELNVASSRCRRRRRRTPAPTPAPTTPAPTTPAPVTSVTPAPVTPAPTTDCGPCSHLGCCGAPHRGFCQSDGTCDCRAPFKGTSCDEVEECL